MIAVSVNGTHCVGGGTSYVNQPCVSVTVCVPGTGDCQTIDDVLLDTGSVGLRVFKQALTLSLPAAAAPGGGALAECVQYADLSADWGPVEVADVVLAKEPAVQVPIQVIDATFGSIPSACPSPESAPSSFNGILGVGVFVADCGTPSCPAAANVYYASSGSTSTPVAVDSSSQVQNPVALLPVDNNGVIVSLPGVAAAGAPSVEGALVLGIGTRANNQPIAAAAVALDGAGEFGTAIDGAGHPRLVRRHRLERLLLRATVEHRVLLRPARLVLPAGHAELLRHERAVAGVSREPPDRRRSRSATSTRSSGRQGTATRSSREIGGSALPGAGVDWGLPFFLGRTVYLGLEGRLTDFGAGPVLAY